MFEKWQWKHLQIINERSRILSDWRDTIWLHCGGWSEDQDLSCRLTMIRTDLSVYRHAAKSDPQNHPPSPTMPRTSNLFITSPRVGAPPAGEMSCLDFSEETRALSGGWRSPGQTWTVTDHTPCSRFLLQLLFVCTSPPPLRLLICRFIYRLSSCYFGCFQGPFIPFLEVFCLMLLSKPPHCRTCRTK